VADIKKCLNGSSRNGFVRARIDGEVVDLAETTALDAKKTHTIEAIVDRIVLKDGISPRLRESIELACRESDGTCIISHEADGHGTKNSIAHISAVRTAISISRRRNRAASVSIHRGEHVRNVRGFGCSGCC
jgi:excinuclease UvrABC ATPase subunit